jgi:large subunit ribosomal protein L7Ae
MVQKKKRVIRKKVAPPPLLTQKTKEPKKVADPLIIKRAKNFGIGQDIQPKRDLTRFVRWPRYIRVQRQRAILFQRIKVPPPINQFRSCTLDKQTATQLFRLLDKYRPESKQQKKERIKRTAEQKASGQEVAPTKRPPVVRFGINSVTNLAEQKKAQLVVIAGDVEPLEIVLHLPSLCRKMGVPYCIIKGGRSRLGQVVRRKSVACIALTQVNPEDKVSMSRLVDTVRTNFNDRFDEIRRQWGGGQVGSKSRAKITKLEKAKEKEMLQAKQTGVILG